MSILNSTPARAWSKTPFAGTDVCMVGGGDNVHTAAYGIAAGIVLPAHHHPVWEIVTVGQDRQLG